MSFKSSEHRKIKSSNGLFPSSLLNNKQKNNQLSFSNAFKNNNQKQKLQNFIDKLRYISINKVVLFGRDEFKRLIISQNRKNDVTELVHYSR